MTPTRRRRLLAVLLILAGTGTAAWLALGALRQNMLYFYTPSDVVAQGIENGVRFRLGGLVVPGSLKRAGGDLNAEFQVTDRTRTMTVRYHGILPDLFREGQGVIAHGALGADGVMAADTVLAKHDENYMPPEVAEALEKAGHPPAARPDNG